MPGEDDRTGAPANRYYADGDKLDPAELIGTPLMDVEAAEQILPRLEERVAGISPKECLQLLYAVANLRFTNWDFVEIIWTPERRRKVEEEAGRLLQRLADAAVRNKDALVNLVEQGLREEVAVVDRNLGNSHYRSVSVEFLAEVLFPYERLAYVRLLLDALGVDVSEGAQGLLLRLDATMRQSLPDIFRSFRESGDPIDYIEPRICPPSFWWARLGQG